VKSSGILSGNAIFSRITLLTIDINLFQPGIEIGRRLNVDFASIYHYSGEALAELNVHAFLWRAPGQLRPGRYIRKIFPDN
jgi:hypothetical protein